MSWKREKDAGQDGPDENVKKNQDCWGGSHQTVSRGPTSRGERKGGKD